MNGIKSILSIDRLDYTKGIINRLLGYEKFLEDYPEWHGKVVLLLIIVPSRTGIDHYMHIKKQVDETVGKINGKFGKIGWNPISYQYNSFGFNKLVAFYKVSDIALVTPLRDGMNLVAKEYVASRENKDGVLILSELAGAVKELGEAVSINPNNIEEIASALDIALKMSDEDQKNCNEIMQQRLRDYNVIYWANDFLQRLNQVVEEQKKINFNFISESDKQKIICDFNSAKNKLLMLDYDGTLAPLVRHPSLAKPSIETLNLLTQLSVIQGVDLTLITGRSKFVLDKWFNIPKLNIVAEHGVWIKYASQEWVLQKEMSNDWKEKILNILKLYTNRVPGSFIEEKEYSLCWHYRNAFSEIAQVKAKELSDDLIAFTANQDLQVLQGSKLIEIRNFSLNKGTAASTLLAKKPYDFILAIGDDLTDEDLFKSLPENSYSIKVGTGQSKAKYNIDNSGSVIEFLHFLIDNNQK